MRAFSHHSSNAHAHHNSTPAAHMATLIHASTHSHALSHCNHSSCIMSHINEAATELLKTKLQKSHRKSTPKSNQQRPNGTKHSCSHYCCYWRYCDKHDFMILVTIIASKLKNVVQTHNKCKQAPNVQDNKRKYDFAKKRGGLFYKRRIWTEILCE